MSIDRKINRIQFLTGNSLKFIAVLTMVIDHLIISANSKFLFLTNFDLLLTFRIQIIL